MAQRNAVVPKQARRLKQEFGTGRQIKVHPADHRKNVKMAKSRGLEKEGRRERILGLRWGPQCRALYAKARVYWGFLRARKPAENIWSGTTGGASRFRNGHTV